MNEAVQVLRRSRLGQDFDDDVRDYNTPWPMKRTPDYRKKHLALMELLTRPERASRSGGSRSNADPANDTGEGMT